MLAAEWGENVVMLIDACRSDGAKNAGMGIGEEKQLALVVVKLLQHRLVLLLRFLKSFREKLLVEQHRQCHQSQR
ncbi:MAG TPA: hypothetical protein DCZ88_12420 [Pseudanabaena sp.]|nr:hypothetical protein [Pseudanabaena sp.]